MIDWVFLGFRRGNFFLWFYEEVFRVVNKSRIYSSVSEVSFDVENFLLFFRLGKR